MRLPGFNAEAAIVETAQTYRLKGEPSETDSQRVRPAMSTACFETCMEHCGGTRGCAHECLSICRRFHVV
jgi:hypothetical protein